MVTVDLTPPSGVPFNPTNQTSYILAPNGAATIPFSTSAITTRYLNATSLSILYGTQIGACFIMLAVMLAMTPRVRFRRLPTLINLAALVLNTIRMVLLAVFFTSSFLNFFVLASGSVRYVEPSAFNVSAAATALSTPVTVLILAALFVQAWSMLRLWPTLYKLPATLMSVGLVLTTVAFNMLTTIVQTRAIIGADRNRLWLWARQTYLALITASICWFCFLFNVRLVMHMWTNRSILPSLKGLKAMDVLVITNGVLMFVPVIFAGMEFANWDNFESASLTQTSVVIVLPLGTLVAQRLANPAWFGSGVGAGMTGAGIDSTNSTGVSRSGMSGVTAVTSASGTSAAKRPLLMSVRSNERRDAGVHRGSGQGAVSTHIAAASEGSVVSEKARAVHADHGDDETMDRDVAGGDLERGVRVDYGIERREERLPTGSS